MIPDDLIPNGYRAIAGGCLRLGDHFVDGDGVRTWEWKDNSSCVYLVIEKIPEPEPEWVPLGPEDIPPGSVIRQKEWSDWYYEPISPSSDGRDAIRPSGDAISYKSMMTKEFLIKRPGQTWQPCRKKK